MCLKHVPDITYTLNIDDIVIYYKEFFFETYTRYSLCFKDILYNFLAPGKVCLKHIPDITFTLNIYDIFALYTI